MKNILNKLPIEISVKIGNVDEIDLNEVMEKVKAL